MPNFQNCTNNLRIKDEIQIDLKSENIDSVRKEIEKHNRLYLKNLKVIVPEGYDVTGLNDLIKDCAQRKVEQIEFTREVEGINPAAILIKNGDTHLDNKCIMQMQEPVDVQVKFVEKKDDKLIEVLGLKSQYKPQLRVAKSKQLSRSRQKFKSKSTSTNMPGMFRTFKDFIVSRNQHRLSMMSHRYIKEKYKEKNSLYTTSALNQLLRYNLLEDFDIYHPPQGFSVNLINNYHIRKVKISYDSNIKNKSDYQIKINPEHNRPYLNDAQMDILIKQLPEPEKYDKKTSIKNNYTDYDRSKKLLLRKYLAEIISLPAKAIAYLEKNVFNKEPVNELVLQYCLDERNYNKNEFKNELKGESSLESKPIFNNKLNYISLTSEDKKKHKALELLDNRLCIKSIVESNYIEHLENQDSNIALKVYNKVIPEFQKYCTELEKINLSNASDQKALTQIKNKIKLYELLQAKYYISIGLSQWEKKFNNIAVALNNIGLDDDYRNYHNVKDTSFENFKNKYERQINDKIASLKGESEELQDYNSTYNSTNDLYDSIKQDIAGFRPNSNFDFNSFVDLAVDQKEEKYAIDILLRDEKLGKLGKLEKIKEDLGRLNGKINGFSRKKLYKKHLLRLYLSKSNDFLKKLSSEPAILLKAVLQSDISFSDYRSCKNKIDSWGEQSKKIFYKLLDKHLQHHDETNLQQMTEFFTKFKAKYQFIDNLKSGDAKENEIPLALDTVESLPLALSEMDYVLKLVPENQRASQLIELLTNSNWNYSSSTSRTSLKMNLVKSNRHFHILLSSDAKRNNNFTKLTRMSQSKKKRLLSLTKIKSILKECKDDMNKPYLVNLLNSIAAEDTKSYIKEDNSYDEQGYINDLNALKKLLKDPMSEVKNVLDQEIKNNLLATTARLANAALSRQKPDKFNDSINLSLYEMEALQLPVYNFKVFVKKLLSCGTKAQKYVTMLKNEFFQEFGDDIYHAFAACAQEDSYTFKEYLYVLQAIKDIKSDEKQKSKAMPYVFNDKKKLIMQLVGVFKLRLVNVKAVKDKLYKLSQEDLKNLTLVEDLRFEHLNYVLNQKTTNINEENGSSSILDFAFEAKNDEKLYNKVKLDPIQETRINQLFTNDTKAKVIAFLKRHMKDFRKGLLNKLELIYKHLDSPKDNNLKLILDSIDQNDSKILDSLVDNLDIEFFKNYRLNKKINKQTLDFLAKLDAKDEKEQKQESKKVEFEAVRKLSHSLIYKYVELGVNNFTEAKTLVDSLRTEPYNNLPDDSQEEIYNLYIKQIEACDSKSLNNLLKKFKKFQKFIIPPNGQQDLGLLSKAEDNSGLSNVSENIENDIILHISLFMGDRKINGEALDINFLNTIIDKISSNERNDDNLNYKIFHVICKLIVNKLYDKSALDDFINKAYEKSELFDFCYKSPPYPPMDKFKGINSKDAYSNFAKDPYGSNHPENKLDDDAKLSNGFYSDHPNAQEKLEKQDIKPLQEAETAAKNKDVNELQRLLKTGNNFEKVASAARLLYISKGYRINTTQYVAVYNSLKNKNTYTKIATGEGKSRINMLLNAILSISPDNELKEEKQDREVNQQNQGVFITSNANLAKRDFVDYQSFFEICGISSILLTENSNYDLEKFKKAQLIFTDKSSWGLFLSAMYARYPKSKVDKVLRAKNLIVDEADTLFYESDPYNISEQTEALKNIEKLYGPIYKFIDNNQNSSLENLLHKFKANNQDLLSGVTDEKLLGLINAAKTAKTLKYGEHFTIEEDGRSARVVVLTDGQRAGFDSTYTGGVHQFLIKRLQLKKIELSNLDGKSEKSSEKSSDSSEQSLINCLKKLSVEIEFLPESLVRYSLKGYELLQTAKSIKAVTGSLGNKALLYGLKNFYSLDDLEISELYPHRKSRRVTPSSVPLFQDQSTFIEEITKQLKSKPDRPVLIVTENNDSVCDSICDSISQGLRDISQAGKDGKVTVDVAGRAGRGTDIKTDKDVGIIKSIKSDTKDYEGIISQAGQNGKVTVAVAGRAGRGTDIKTEHAEGLLVILTFIPTDREYQQIIGRCARQGQKGKVVILLYDEEYQADNKITIEDFEAKTKAKSNSNSRLLWINNIKDRYINENFRRQFKEYLEKNQEEESSLLASYAKFREKVETEWGIKVDEILKACCTFDEDLTNVNNVALAAFKEKVIEYWGEFNKDISANIASGTDNLEVPNWAKVILIQENIDVAELIEKEPSSKELAKIDLKALCAKARQNKVCKVVREANQEVENLKNESKDTSITDLSEKVEKLYEKIEVALKKLDSEDKKQDDDSNAQVNKELEQSKKKMKEQLQKNKKLIEKARKVAEKFKYYKTKHNSVNDITAQYNSISVLNRLIVDEQPNILENNIDKYYKQLVNKFNNLVKNDQAKHLQKETRDLILLVIFFTAGIASLLFINILGIEFAIISSLGIIAFFGICMALISYNFDWHSAVINKNFKYVSKIRSAKKANNTKQKYVIFTRHGLCSQRHKLFGFKANTALEHSCKNKIQGKGNIVFNTVKKLFNKDVKEIKELASDCEIYYSPMERAKQTCELLFKGNTNAFEAYYCLTESSIGLSGYNIRKSSDVLRYMVENIWITVGSVLLAAVPFALSFVTVYWPIGFIGAIPLFLIICNLLYYVFSDVLSYMAKNIWTTVGSVLLAAVPFALSFTTLYSPISLICIIPLFLIICKGLYDGESGVKFSNESQKHTKMKRLIKNSKKDLIWFVGHGKNFKNFINEELAQDIERFDYCDSVVVKVNLDEDNNILSASVEGRINLNQNTGMVSLDNDNLLSVVNSHNLSPSPELAVESVKKNDIASTAESIRPPGG